MIFSLSDCDKAERVENYQINIKDDYACYGPSGVLYQVVLLHCRYNQIISSN